MVEERLVHPAVVAVRVVRRHRVVFVEVERDDAREVEALLLVQADQLAVQPDGRGAGGQAEDGGPAGGVAGGSSSRSSGRRTSTPPRCGEEERRDAGVRQRVQVRVQGGHEWGVRSGSGVVMMF